MVCLKDPRSREVACFIMHTLPFGALASVLPFLEGQLPACPGVPPRGGVGGFLFPILDVSESSQEIITVKKKAKQDR